MGRSRYKFYWYSICIKLIKQYPFKGDKTPLEDHIKVGIDRAIENTLALPNGDSRMRVIELVYFRKTHTIDGAAMEVYTSGRTAHRWLINFVYSVAKELGFYIRP